MRWLLAISMSCRDRVARTLTEADFRAFASPNFHLFINIYDQSPGSPNLQSCLPEDMVSSPFVRLSTLPGYMTLFWKHVLTPAVTAPYDLIALKDADLALSHGLVVSEVEMWLQLTNASIVTPAIAGVDPSGKGISRADVGARSAIMQRAFDASCAAVHSAMAEQMKISRRDAFERSLRSTLLLNLTDELLRTDSFLMSLWCILAEQQFGGRPGCVHLRTQFAVHLNSKAISGKMKAAYTARGQNLLVPHLFNQWRWAFLDFTFNFSRGCWPLHGGERTEVTLATAAGHAGPIGNPLGSTRAMGGYALFHGGHTGLPLRRAPFRQLPTPTAKTRHERLYLQHARRITPTTSSAPTITMPAREVARSAEARAPIRSGRIDA